jgi:hypothetical protein
MKIGMTVNVGGYNSMKFESSEQATKQDCARDLIAQMEPIAKAYPVLVGKIQEIRSAYQV